MEIDVREDHKKVTKVRFCDEAVVRLEDDGLYIDDADDELLGLDWGEVPNLIEALKVALIHKAEEDRVAKSGN